MSFCEFHPEYQKKLRNVYGDAENQTLFNLQDELKWGISYRHMKKKEKDSKSIPPKTSPVDIPFKLCRERERKRKHDKDKKRLKKTPATRKLSLLEKSMLSQNEYMEYLSTPNPKFEEPPPKKRRKKCLMEPCSPRIVMLATPNKRRVFANWKDFYDRLPTEMVMRFEQILHTNNCLEPRDARYYYKQLDRQKKKKRRAKKLRKIKKQKEKEKGNQKWMKNQIEQTVKAIMDFILEEPVFVLNYKQLLLSDGILTQMNKRGILKKPKRNTKKPYKTTLIEISDKLALWVDTLIRFVDVQAVESDEDIPPLTISSVEVSSEEESEGEEESEEDEEGVEDEEEEEDEEGEEDEGGESEGDIKPPSSYAVGELDDIDEFGEFDDDEFDDDEYELGEDALGKGGIPVEYTKGDKKSAKKGFKKKRKPKKGKYPGVIEGDMGEEFGEGEFDQMFGELNGDQLEKLIKILSNCSEEFLDSSIDQENLPGVTYRDVLNRLIELREKLDQQLGQSILEQLMISWAMQNNPDEVDSKLLRKIKEIAAFLEDTLKKEKPLSEQQLADDNDKGVTSEAEVADDEEDQLKKLVDIIEKSPADLLKKEIDRYRLPGITHKAVRNRLVRLKSEWNQKRESKSFIETLLTDWATNNNAEDVNEILLNKIRACSVVLEEWLRYKSLREERELSVDLTEYEVVADLDTYKSVHLIVTRDDKPEEEDIHKAPDAEIHRLIEILSSSSDEFLSGAVDEKKSPGLTYKDLLNKLIEIKNELEIFFSDPEISLMEQVLNSWVNYVAPGKLTPALASTIREVAIVLNEWGKVESFAEAQKEERPSSKDDGTQKALDEKRGPPSPNPLRDTNPDFSELSELHGAQKEERPSSKDDGTQKALDEKRGPPSPNPLRDTNLDFSELSELHGALGVIPEDEVWGQEYGEPWKGRPLEGTDERIESEFGKGEFEEGEVIEGEVGEIESGEIEAGESEAGEIEAGESEEGESEAGEGEAGQGETGEEGVHDLSVLYEKGVEEGEMGEKVEGEGVIKGHKPSTVFEHSPNTVCCLSLKIWAIWLLEITHNAHSWTKWVHELIKKIREYASIVRGDVILSNGNKRVLLKKEWREFVKSAEEKIIAWRQYSSHVKELSLSIIENFRGKNIVCCPKCLQDHLIKNVVTAHHTLRALTEAMNCAAYWRRSFDSMVELTEDLTKTLEQQEGESESSESGSEASLAEEPLPCTCRRRLQRVPEREEEESDESIYELEEIETGTLSQQRDDTNYMEDSNNCKRKM